MPKVTSIARDPFARSETVRECVPPSSRCSCANCGREGAKYRYGHHADGLNTRAQLGSRVFCSVSCWRDYSA